MYIENLEHNYLVHHGIKGQSWGKKNGPPYPLDYKSHSSAEKKQNPKTKIDGQPEKSNNKKNGLSDNTNDKKKGLTDKQKKIIKGAVIGVSAVAVTAGAVYIAKKYNISVKEILDKSSDIKLNENLSKEKFEKVIIENAKKSRKEHAELKIENDCTNIFSQMIANIDGHMDLKASGNGKGNSITKMMEYFSDNGKKLSDICQDRHDLYREIPEKDINSSEKVKSFIKRTIGNENNSYGYLRATVNNGFGINVNHGMLWFVKDDEVIITDGIHGSNAEKYFDRLNANKESFNGIIFRCDNLSKDYDKMILDGILKRV